MRFFPLVFALAIPFWILGAVTRLELLPGLPVAALTALCPGFAAGMLVYREQGAAGFTRFWKRSFDYHRIQRKRWYFPVFLLMPAMMLASYLLMRWIGLALPRPEIPLLTTPLLFAIFFPMALAEELGWSGYATEPMQARWGELATAIALGVVWAIWHLVPLLQANRATDWITGWSIGTVANRVIIVWLYNNTGRSVFAAAVHHTMSNVTWQLFPNHGSHYDPRVSGAVFVSVAAIIAGGLARPGEASASP